MKILFRQTISNAQPVETEITPLNLKESIEKTRQALEIAYSGFDNALEEDMIDSYIFEINALQKRYKHLIELAEKQPATESKRRLYQHSPIRALVSHVFS
ncbi:MAG: DUF2508 family protein [Lachnospiraceae bacterium]|nr:DUF2508 family protein [Lachnospiraceae bacterium]